MAFVKKDHRKWWYYPKDCKDFRRSILSPWGCRRSDNCRWRSQKFVEDYSSFISRDEQFSGMYDKTRILAVKWESEDD